jgi:NO-binding membrane sensor protein with MHYT domain
MKIVGFVLLILGIIGVVYFGIQAINQSESFNVPGAEIAVSTANWTPLIVSGVMLIIGIILMSIRKK